MFTKQANSTDSLLTRQQAAEYLGISVSALATWACTKRYDLPMIKVGRLVKYRVQDLNDFLNRHTVGKEVA